MQVPLQKKYASDQKKFLQEIRIPADVHQPTASPLVPKENEKKKENAQWCVKHLQELIPRDGETCVTAKQATNRLHPWPVWRVLSTLPTGSLPVIPVQFSSCLLQTNPPALLPGWGMINIASSGGSQTFLVRNLPGKRSSTSRSVFATGSCPCLALQFFLWTKSCGSYLALTIVALQQSQSHWIGALGAKWGK